MSRIGAPPAVVRSFVTRTFSPWNAQASFEAALTPDVSIGGGATYMRTAYYRASTFEIRLTRRFTGAALKRFGWP